jgi:hypothetical protein
MGRKAEAKTEFEKTRTLQNMANQSVREQMRRVEARPADQNADIQPK